MWESLLNCFRWRFQEPLSAMLDWKRALLLLPDMIFSCHRWFACLSFLRMHVFPHFPEADTSSMVEPLPPSVCQTCPPDTFLTGTVYIQQREMFLIALKLKYENSVLFLPNLSKNVVPVFIIPLVKCSLQSTFVFLPGEQSSFSWIECFLFVCD